MIRSWLVKALLVIVIVFSLANVAYGQDTTRIRADTMDFTLVGPAVKGDTFVTVRRVHGMIDMFNTHVDEMSAAYIHLRSTTEDALHRTDSLRYVTDSLKNELKKAKICRIGDPIWR